MCAPVDESSGRANGLRRPLGLGDGCKASASPQPTAHDQATTSLLIVSLGRSWSWLNQEGQPRAVVKLPLVWLRLVASAGIALPRVRQRRSRAPAPQPRSPSGARVIGADPLVADSGSEGWRFARSLQAAS